MLGNTGVCVLICVGVTTNSVLNTYSILWVPSYGLYNMGSYSLVVTARIHKMPSTHTINTMPCFALHLSQYIRRIHLSVSRHTLPRCKRRRGPTVEIPQPPPSTPFPNANTSPASIEFAGPAQVAAAVHFITIKTSHNHITFIRYNNVNL